jgi:5,10-methylenetetrahydromethanopterin reductase
VLEVGISCDGREPLAAFHAKVAAGEGRGATSLWLASHLFQRDPISQAAMALATTTRLRAVLMAVSPYTVHPVQAAMAAATLDEFFPGRIALCYAAGAPADLNAIGIAAAKPVRVLREALELTSALLGGETVSFAGETFKINNRRMAAGHHPVPILLAASGPQMLELAGAIADGVLISAGTSVEFVKWSLEKVHSGAKGRKVSTHGLVYASVDEDEQTAHGRLRRILAIVLRGSHHAANLEQAGSRLDQDRLNQAVLAEDWDAAQRLIGDDIILRHAASGRREQVQRRLAEYHAAGLDEVVVSGAHDGAQVSAILNAAAA